MFTILLIFNWLVRKWCAFITILCLKWISFRCHGNSDVLSHKNCDVFHFLFVIKTPRSSHYCEVWQFTPTDSTSIVYRNYTQIISFMINYTHKMTCAPRGQITKCRLACAFVVRNSPKKAFSLWGQYYSEDTHNHLTRPCSHYNLTYLFRKLATKLEFWSSTKFLPCSPEKQQNMKL